MKRQISHERRGQSRRGPSSKHSRRGTGQGRWQRRPKSERKLLSALQAMAGYLIYVYDNGVEPREALMNLAHDIGGLANAEPHFAPRTSGYMKYYLKRKEAQSYEGAD